MPGSVIEQLTARIKTDFTKYYADMQKAGVSMEDLGQRWRRVGTSINSVANRMGLAVGAVSGVAVRQFGKFEETMVRVGGVTQTLGEKGAAGFNQLKEAALTAGATTRFTANQSATALEALGLAGLNAQQATQALTPTLQLASAAQIDIAQAAEISAKTMKSFGMEAKDLNRINDVLVGGFTKSNQNIFQLYEGLTKVGATATVMGEDLEDITALLGVMADAGVDASTAGTALRNSFIALSAPSAKAQRIINELGLDTSQNLMGVLGQLEQKLKGNATEMQQLAIFTDLFGRRGGPQLLAVFNAGIAKAQGLSTEIKSLNGVAQNLEQAGLNTVNGQIDLMISALDGLVISLGGELAPILKQTVQDLTRFIDANRPQIVQLLTQSIGEMASTGKEMVQMLIESGPALIEMGSNLFSMLQPVLELIKQYPQLGAVILAFKMGSLLGLNELVVSLTGALWKSGKAMKALGAASAGEGAGGLTKFAGAGKAILAIGLAVLIGKIIDEVSGLAGAVRDLNKQLEKTKQLEEEIRKIRLQEKENTFDEAMAIQDPKERMAALKKIAEVEKQNQVGLANQRKAIDKEIEEERHKGLGALREAEKKLLPKVISDMREGILDATGAGDFIKARITPGLVAAEQQKEMLEKNLEDQNDLVHKINKAYEETRRQLLGENQKAAKQQIDTRNQPFQHPLNNQQVTGAGQVVNTPTPAPSEDLTAALRESEVARMERETSGFGELSGILGQGANGSQAAQFMGNMQGATPGLSQQFGQAVDALTPAQRQSQEFMDSFTQHFLHRLQQLRQKQEEDAAAAQARQGQMQAVAGENEGFRQSIIKLAEARKIEKEEGGKLIQQAHSLRWQFENGKISIEQFNNGMSRLKNATDQATMAAKKKEEQEKRAALLRGDFKGAGLNFQKALEEKLAQARMQQFNQQVDEVANRMFGLGNATGNATQGMQQLGNGVNHLQGQMNQFSAGMGGGQDPEKLQQAAARISGFLNSRSGAIASLQSQIQLLNQNMQVVDTGRQRARIQDEIDALVREIRTLQSTPPPAIGPASGDIAGESALGEGNQEIVINLPNVTQFDQAGVATLSQELDLEQQRRGRFL